MSQAYVDILPTDYLADAPADINSTNDALRTSFAGTVAPTNPVAYMTWYDTATGYKKERNAANDAWIVVGVIGQQYGGLLPKSGGTMTGAINMGGYTIDNMSDFGSDYSAATKLYVDTKAPLYSPVFAGQPQVATDYIPTLSNALTDKKYVDLFLRLAGGTMTGPVLMSADAALALAPVTLQQLKTFVLFNTTTGHRHDGTDARKVQGVNIGSQGITAGYVLKADGAGGVSWQAP